MTDQSIADFVRDALSKVDNIDIFKDSKEKQKFISELQTGSNFSKDSIRLAVSGQLKKRVKTEGKDENDFSKKVTKKYNSKLDVSVKSDKVEIKPGDKTLDDAVKNKKDMPALQNPKSTDGTFTIDAKTYESFGVAANSIISAFVDEMEDLSEREKESFGACIKMGFGDMIETSQNIRRLVGMMGLTGIFVSKIKKARKKSKAKRELEKSENKTKATETTPELKPTPTLRPIEKPINFEEPTPAEIEAQTKANRDYMEATDK